MDARGLLAMLVPKNFSFKEDLQVLDALKLSEDARANPSTTQKATSQVRKM